MDSVTRTMICHEERAAPNGIVGSTTFHDRLRSSIVESPDCELSPTSTSLPAEGVRRFSRDDILAVLPLSIESHQDTTNRDILLSSFLTLPGYFYEEGWGDNMRCMKGDSIRFSVGSDGLVSRDQTIRLPRSCRWMWS